MFYIIFFFLVLISLEVLIHKLILEVRKNFQWLIIKGLDDNVCYDEKLFEKFKIHSFSSYLGWEPKAGKNGRDLLNGKEIKYEIGSSGQRVSPSDGKKLLKKQLLILGDSFAFGRQIESKFTISNFLNSKSSIKSYNFGVGNYGLDQAFLRLKKIYDNLEPSYAVFIVVPETICRIQSSWKHFYEYGNILAFKPRFIISSSELLFIENPLQLVKKENFEKAVKISKKFDKFYLRKFKKDLIKRPYILSIFKNSGIALKILISFYFNKLIKGCETSWKINKFQDYVLQKNSKITDLEYKNPSSTNLLIKIIHEINKYCSEKKIIPIISFIPQYQDLNDKSLKLENYSRFISQLKKSVSIKVIDFKNIFEKFNYPLEKLYLNKMGGTHLSKLGNQVVSEIINKEILKILKDNK